MLFSIVTVVLNNKEQIEQTILSVISQKMNNDSLEYIIIDGGSTDGTLEVIKKYEEYITYWETGKDTGIYNAMNRGINWATGDVIAFMNAGDWYEPNALSQVANLFEDKNIFIVYGIVNSYIDDKRIGHIGIDFKDNMNYEEVILNGNPFCQQGIFYRRQVFGTIGCFDEQYKILADYEWNMRAYFENIQFEIMDVVVANYRLGGVSSDANELFERIHIRFHYLKKNKLIDKVFWDSVKNSLFRYVVTYETDELKNDLFDVNHTYYIWGLGKDGTLLYEYLKKNSIKIEKVIDSNSAVGEKINLNVISPKKFFDEVEIDEKLTIVIGTTKYYEEIYSRLISHGINKKCIIGIYDIGEEFMNDYLGPDIISYYESSKRL